jgi:hypothetical protein
VEKEMIKIYIWGSGYIANEALTSMESVVGDIGNNDIFHIKGIIDNNCTKWHTFFHGYEIVSPGEAVENGFDNIVILMENDWDVGIQAKFGYRIPSEKVKNKDYFLKLILMLKYRDSNNAEIQQTLKYLENNDISMFNQYLKPAQMVHPVIWDKKINLPYIEFEDIVGKIHKMYFPRNHQFDIQDGIQVLPDILREQYPGSPHLYTYEGHGINNGDVIVDGGVCEGNFALRYAEVASKIYLFEPDHWWDEAHHYTFEQYSDKIEYFHSGLSNREGRNSVVIDNIFADRRKPNFVKMDIEGSEINALEGAEQTLKNGNTKLSICSYHKKEDERLIKNILHSYGYRTSVSNGVVVFLWDDDIWRSLDFRKGIVYGDK